MLSPETVRIVTETTPAGSSARWRVQAAAPDGLISNDLYDQVNVGDRLEVSPPCGEFTLKPANGAGPVVLLAGGLAGRWDRDHAAVVDGQVARSSGLDRADLCPASGK